MGAYLDGFYTMVKYIWLIPPKCDMIKSFRREQETEKTMKRWKGAALLLLCTIVLLRLLQDWHSRKENAHVPVLGIVTTAAEDDRREAQSGSAVHAAEEHGFKVLEMPVERSRRHRLSVR